MQWALSSENIDMAIICKDAADKFLKRDDNFINMGPLVKNSDVILLKDRYESNGDSKSNNDMKSKGESKSKDDGESAKGTIFNKTSITKDDKLSVNSYDVKKIGVVQNRFYQVKLASAYFPGAEVHPFIGNALAYALESSKVDAVVIDGLKAFKLDGKRLSTYDKGEYVTYVLVVNREFSKTDSFRDFVRLYNKSVKELEDKAKYRKALSSFFSKSLSDSEWTEIESWKIKYLKIKTER